MAAAQEAKGPGGRPTLYSEDIANRVCEWIAEGNSLRSFVREHDDSPALSSICLWIVTHDQFSERYARAREAGGFAHADDILETVALIKDGEIDPNSARVIIDAKKWVAERMSPKHHGARQAVDHTSSDGSMTPKPGLDVSRLSTEALAEIMAAADAAKSE